MQVKEKKERVKGYWQNRNNQFNQAEKISDPFVSDSVTTLNSISPVADFKSIVAQGDVEVIMNCYFI
jgi:hypothetical protein